LGQGIERVRQGQDAVEGGNVSQRREACLDPA
jgi:hypothetical protein